MSAEQRSGLWIVAAILCAVATSALMITAIELGETWGGVLAVLGTIITGLAALSCAGFAYPDDPEPTFVPFDDLLPEYFSEVDYFTDSRSHHYRRNT